MSGLGGVAYLDRVQAQQDRLALRRSLERYGTLGVSGRPIGAPPPSPSELVDDLPPLPASAADIEESLEIVRRAAAGELEGDFWEPPRRRVRPRPSPARRRAAVLAHLYPSSFVTTSQILRLPDVRALYVDMSDPRGSCNADLQALHRTGKVIVVMYAGQRRWSRAPVQA